MINAILISLFSAVLIAFLVLSVLFIGDIKWGIRCGNISDTVPYICFEVFCIMVICLSLCGIVATIKGV